MILDLLHSGLCGAGIVLGYAALDTLTNGKPLLALFSAATLLYCFDKVVSLLVMPLK